MTPEWDDPNDEAIGIEFDPSPAADVPIQDMLPHGTEINMVVSVSPFVMMACIALHDNHGGVALFPKCRLN